jgi:hypothetical protein
MQLNIIQLPSKSRRCFSSDGKNLAQYSALPELFRTHLETFSELGGDPLAGALASFVG